MIKEIKDWISEKEFFFSKIFTLVILLVFGQITIMTFTRSYIDNGWINLVIFFTIEAAIVFYWYWNRAVFPKCGNETGNIVIAITTENAKQKTRIKHDFQKEIEKQLREHNLDTKYKVTVLHNHLSRVTQNKINLYFRSLKAGIKDSEDVKDFQKLKSRLNAKVIIYGDLITRNATNSTYYLSLDAILCRGSIELHNEFAKLCKKEITFLEENELTGFKENAEHVFFTASYMLGLATFIDNNFIHGIEIWKNLEKFIKERKELSVHSDKILKLKATSYILQSRLLYFSGSIEESVIFREKYLAIFPNEYDKYLNEAINEVKTRNDPEMALEFVKRAKNVAPNGNGVWRYSMLYVLIRLGWFQDALKILDEILTSTFRDEFDIVNQVIAYNQTCLMEDLSHIQTDFIIGVFKYKKLDRPIPAYENLETFVQRTNGNENWQDLNQRARMYLDEINTIIGVKN